MSDPKVVQQNLPLILERGDGVYVFDIDGRRYLDTVASLWNVNVGHDRREVIDASPNNWARWPVTRPS